MTAAEARQTVRDLDVEDEAAKVVADAPPLSPTQVDTLRAIFLSANVNEADVAVGPARPERLLDPHRRSDRG